MSFQALVETFCEHLTKPALRTLPEAKTMVGTGVNYTIRRKDKDGVRRNHPVHVPEQKERQFLSPADVRANEKMLRDQRTRVRTFFSGLTPREQRKLSTFAYVASNGSVTETFQEVPDGDYYAVLATREQIQHGLELALEQSVDLEAESWDLPPESEPQEDPALEPESAPSETIPASDETITPSDETMAPAAEDIEALTPPFENVPEGEEQP